MADKKNRIFVSNLLFGVLTGRLSVLKAVSQFPKDADDKSLDVAFCALMHYEADEDFRAKDALYREEQDGFIEILAQMLSRGENLPQNIIDEYEKFYPESIIYKKDNKENIIKRLLKIINF